MKQFCKTLVSLIAVIIYSAFDCHSILDATFAAFRAVKYHSRRDGSHLSRNVVRFFVAGQIAAQMVTRFLDRSGHIDGVETIVSNIQCVHE